MREFRVPALVSKRKKYPTVTMTPEAHAQLDKYAKSKGLKMSMIIETFIAMGVKHDIYEDNWIDSLKLEVERIKEHDEAGSGCVALAISVNDEKKRDYRCVWFRKDKPPQVRKLGNTKKMKDAACLACGKTGELAKGLTDRDTRIRELEKGLESREREIYKIPSCEGGAHLTPDALGFEGCRRSNTDVDILRFCQVVENGPCSFFKEIVVGVGEKK